MKNVFGQRLLVHRCSATKEQVATKMFISQKYRTIDATVGGEEYCYFRTKEDSFKPSKNKGAGLTLAFLEEEASSKGLKKGFDYFISLEDYRTNKLN